MVDAALTAQQLSALDDDDAREELAWNLSGALLHAAQLDPAPPADACSASVRGWWGRHREGPSAQHGRLTPPPR